MRKKAKLDADCTISILNLCQDDIVNHQIILIIGKVTCTRHNHAEDNITCKNFTSDTASIWPLKSNIFKAFVKIQLGKNRILFQHCSQSFAIDVHYKPSENKRYIRLVYIVCKNSDGTVDSPAGQTCDSGNAMQRISFNALLLQSFMAENLMRHGFGRKTFKFDKEDDDGSPKVHLFSSNLDVSNARDMSGDELYSFFYEELKESSLANENCKFWVFMSCTKYCPPTSEEEFCEKDITTYVKAHTALGGGDMALFGTACLHTWASGLHDLVAKFTDCAKLDRNTLFDDSCGRGTYWANYATTLGASMHELGHCLDLPHTATGIMGRGFDDMNLFFLPHEADEQFTPDVIGISPYIDKGAHWHRSSAVSLSVNRWINANCEAKKECNSPIVCLRANVLGPVGAPPNDMSFANSFDSVDWLDREGATLLGFVFYFKEYLYAFEVLGLKRGTNPETCEEIFSPVVGRKNHDDARVCRVTLTEPEETIVKVNVRAGCWLDGIQITTTHRSSIWCGGTGGRMYTFPLSGKRFKGFLAKGGNYVGSLGLQIERHIAGSETDSSIKTNSLYEHNSSYGPIGREPVLIKKPVQCFDATQWLEKEALQFAGLVLFATKSINAIQVIGRKLKDDQNLKDIVLSPVIGSRYSSEEKGYKFLLDDRDEFICKIEVRSGSRIDGLKIVTNRKSSMWFGGNGGKLRIFEFYGERRFKGLQVTAGTSLLCIHINVERPAVIDAGAVEEEKFVTIESPSEVRLLEVQDTDGEVYYFKECEGKKTMIISKDSILQGYSTCTLRVVNGDGASSTNVISA